MYISRVYKSNYSSKSHGWTYLYHGQIKLSLSSHHPRNLMSYINMSHIKYN